uniref:Uncharacterized protein n=1 Tax=Anabas testudineus TaxID=64144 RepID=A0A7N6ABG4_ANATE
SGRSSGSLEQSLPAAALRSCRMRPRALDARSLASWNSSLSDRLVSMTDPLSQNSLPLFCRPESRNSPVDLSSIPAMSLSTHQKSFPDWASPPRM